MTRHAEEGATRPTPAPLVETEDSLPIGLRVQGRYRIVGRIGTGAFGLVCLAEDEATGHPVALRLLPRGMAGAPPSAQAFQRPGRPAILASTAHPGLVRMLQIGEAQPGRTFVVMEVVKGRSLGEMGTPIPLRDALRLALDLGGPVEALHKLGLVHGALRPRNVMVLDDGRVKLMDVELVGLRNAPVPEGVLAPAPPEEYLAPEQIRRAPLSPKTDVYAFAVILYELLCGAPPFQGLTREAVLAKQVTEMPAPIRWWERSVPASVERVIMNALEKNPEQRPRMQDVLDCLRAQSSALATRWKRAVAVVGGAVLAGLVAVSASWGPPTPRPSAPRPAPPAEQAPVRPPQAARAPVKSMRATPAVGPASSATVRPSAARPSPLPALPPPSLPTRAERLARPAVPVVEEADDPGAIIDWLLNHTATRRE